MADLIGRCFERSFHILRDSFALILMLTSVAASLLILCATSHNSVCGGIYIVIRLVPPDAECCCDSSFKNDSILCIANIG